MTSAHTAQPLTFVAHIVQHVSFNKAAPTPRARQYFSPVPTGWQRLTDRFMAFIHAVQRCDRFSDNVAIYRDELLLKVKASRQELDAEIVRQNTAREREKTLLKDNTDAETKRLEKGIEFAGQRRATYTNMQDAVWAGTDTDFDKAEKNYLTWREILRRPPFFERVETLSDHVQKKYSKYIKKSETPNKEKFGIKRAIKWITDTFLHIYPLASLPIDIAFTLPAWELLLKGNPVVPLCAAILFTGALYVLGDIGGACWKRMMRRAPAPASDKDYTTKCHVLTAVFVAVIITTGIALASFGATLRTLVPERANLDSKSTEIPRQLSTLAEDDPRRPDLVETLRKIGEQRNNLLKSPPSFYNTIDGLVSFSLYLTLFLSAGARRIIIHDPIFEYEAAWIEYAAGLQNKWRTHIVIDTHIDDLEKEIETLTTQLECLKKAPQEVTALKGQAERLHHMDVILQDLQGQQKNYEQNATQYVENRYKRYAKYYLLFRLWLPRDVRKTIEWYIRGNYTADQNATGSQARDDVASRDFYRADPRDGLDGYDSADDEMRRPPAHSNGRSERPEFCD